MWETLEFSLYPHFNYPMADSGTNSPETAFFPLMFTFPIHLLPALIPLQDFGVYKVFMSPLWDSLKTESGTPPTQRFRGSGEELQDLHL